MLTTMTTADLLSIVFAVVKTPLKPRDHLNLFQLAVVVALKLNAHDFNQLPNIKVDL